MFPDIEYLIAVMAYFYFLDGSTQVAGETAIGYALACHSVIENGFLTEVNGLKLPRSAVNETLLQKVIAAVCIFFFQCNKTGTICGAWVMIYEV